MAWATLPADVCWALNEYERQRAVLSADCAPPAWKGVAFGHCFPSFFPALRAHKGKGKVETFLKKSFTKKTFTLASLGLRLVFAQFLHLLPQPGQMALELRAEAVVWALFKGGLNGAPGELRGQGAGLLQGGAV